MPYILYVRWRLKMYFILMHFQKWFWCGVLLIAKYFKNWNKFAFFFTLKLVQINDHGGNISDSGLGWQYCQWHCLQNLFFPFS